MAEKAKTVKVDLPTARTHKGVAYGPGEGIEAPEAAGWHKEEKPSKAEKKGAKK